MINKHMTAVPETYLFSEIGKKVNAFTEANPDKKIIRMGIGDVTQPLVPSVVEAMRKAVFEMGTPEGFQGYPPAAGQDFLRAAIAEHDYKARGLSIEADDIIVTDGAKSDTANIGDIFSTTCRVMVCDPVYPVYVDVNAMSGRAGHFNGSRWSELVYAPVTAENGFIPELPAEKVDMIYLCYPNNPTGTTLTKAQLQTWVDYANDTGAVILFDSAYERYISSPDVPHSIYECKGAHLCAIEFRSFSKTAGFTGVRCGYTVVPRSLIRDGVSLRKLWLRRQSTKFNGVSYISQRGAEAVYSEQGCQEVDAVVRYYMENAKLLKAGLHNAGYTVFGGVDAPYIWLKTPEPSSWAFFDKLLTQHGIVGTPGVGFGPSGEGYFRLTAFSSRENTIEAVARLAKG